MTSIYKNFCAGVIHMRRPRKTSTTPKKRMQPCSVFLGKNVSGQRNKTTSSPPTDAVVRQTSQLRNRRTTYT